MLKPKKVLITGATKGIGLEAVKKFLIGGFEVVAVGRDFSSFGISDNKIKQINFDLREVERIEELVDGVGEIDVLINNAGIMHALLFDNYPNDKRDEILKINIEVPVKLIELFSMGMVKKGNGRIVNVSSIAGEIGHPDVWYGITKAGIINMTKSFAKILGPKGVVVNSIAPGPTETDLLDVIPQERKADIRRSAYLDRFAKPIEIAETIY